MTDTARFADVVLPATTHFEADDFRHSYGSYTLQRMAPVIGRVGLSRTNDEVAAGLAVRLGLPPESFDPDSAAMIAGALTDHRALDGARVLRQPGETIQFVDTHPDGGRAHLEHVGSELPLPRYVALDESFPLALISPASRKTINSMFGEFDGPDPVIRLHPDDAAARSIVDGSAVRVWNAQGEIRQTAKVTRDLLAGVCVVEKGCWITQLPGGRNVNTLVPATINDLASGACFNDARASLDGSRRSRSGTAHSGSPPRQHEHHRSTLVREARR